MYSITYLFIFKSQVLSFYSLNNNSDFKILIKHFTKSCKLIDQISAAIEKKIQIYNLLYF